MMIYEIDLATLAPHGRITAETVGGGGLRVKTSHALPYGLCKPGYRNSHYLELPGRYELPMRVDVTAKIDAPALYLEIGNGFAAFGSHGGDSRSYEDICEPKQKTNGFNNSLIMNEFNDISLIFGYQEVQFLVNGEERYYSKLEPYFKSRRLAVMNDEGFRIRVACDKNVDLTIRSIKITEYIGIAEIIRPLAIDLDLAQLDQFACHNAGA